MRNVRLARSNMRDRFGTERSREFEAKFYSMISMTEAKGGSLKGHLTTIDSLHNYVLSAPLGCASSAHANVLASAHSRVARRLLTSPLRR
jgi:hypothetical protein